MTHLPVSLQRTLDAMVARGGNATAPEIGEALDVSTGSARHYLVQLKEAGAAEVIGIKGKAKLYKVTEDFIDQARPFSLNRVEHEPKARRCLMCRETFISEWPGERVCGHCKTLSTWKAGIQVVDSEQLSDRQGRVVRR